jgi:hypothetical protein
MVAVLLPLTSYARNLFVYSQRVCLDCESINARIILFGLIVEISDISENVKRVLIFTILS